jgi:hypothetical protein
MSCVSVLYRRLVYYTIHTVIVQTIFHIHYSSYIPFSFIFFISYSVVVLKPLSLSSFSLFSFIFPLRTVPHSLLYLTCLYLQFDYLIVFPLTEGVYTDPLYHKGGRLYGARIAWSDVASTWSKSEISDSDATAFATSTAVTDYGAAAAHAVTNDDPIHDVRSLSMIALSRV